jgi:hypothetical protein
LRFIKNSVGGNAPSGTNVVSVRKTKAWLLEVIKFHGVSNSLASW